MAEYIGNDESTDVSGMEEAKPLIPEDGGELLETLEKDFERLKQQKARQSGGVEGFTLTNLCFLHDEQYIDYKSRSLFVEGKEKNKLYLTFNLIGPRFNKLIGRLSAFNAPFKARPNKKDPQALEEAEVVDRMTIALDEKLDDPSRLRETLYWMGVGGTAFRHVTWVPNATIEAVPITGEDGSLQYKTPDGTIVPQMQKDALIQAGIPEEAFEIAEEPQITGEVGDEVLSPFNVFIDQTCRSVADLPPGSWVHVATIKTIEWIKENFGEDVGLEPAKDINLIVSKIRTEGEASGGVNLKDIIPFIQGSCDENDPPMVLFVQSYQNNSVKFPKGRYVCWVPDQKVLHDDECPYGEIPLVDFHWTPVTTSFWTKAYITPLIAPQRFVNKRMSQLGEQANAAIYSSILLGAGLTESDIPADFPGVVMNGMDENGVPRIGRTPPPEIPQWFLQSIELAVKMFNDAAGGADLFEETKFPGQLRGPMAVPMLQEILDTQWGPLFAHLGERLARVKQMRLNRVKQFYPPIRTMHYTDKTMKDEVLTFHTEEILRSGTNFNITVERGSLLPELRSLREARLKERLASPLAILYMDERTGRIDKSKLAADLQFGDTGREGRESKYRKLAQEINKFLWTGQAVPPVLPFYDHTAMLDELENEMATTEFLKASPMIQQAFGQRWEQHRMFLQQEAMAQQQAMQGAMVHNAVAQATQQAAAMAAADAVNETQTQMKAQSQQPTDQYLAAAQAKTGGGGPPKEKPQAKSRKLTIEEKS